MADYFYACARVRALEAGLLGREGLLTLSEAPTLDACYNLLAERGYALKRDEQSGAILREETLLSMLLAAYGEIAELTKEADTEVFSMWRYPYDCNNAKAAIKCFIRKKDPTGMMFDFGTVSVQDMIDAARINDFSALPTHMAQAAQDAVSAFAKTGNPQMIDLLLDRACYSDMLEAAEMSGVEYATRLVKTKIDLINLVTCVRILRMKNGEAGKMLLRDSLLAGGFLPDDLTMELYDAGERGFWERLLYTDYKRFSEAVGGKTPSLTAVECASDNFFMNVVREARFVASGAEVLIGYLLGVESEMRNVRVILAGKAVGLQSETVWERIRDSYV